MYKNPTDYFMHVIATASTADKLATEFSHQVQRHRLLASTPLIAPCREKLACEMFLVLTRTSMSSSELRLP